MKEETTKKIKNFTFYYHLKNIIQKKEEEEEVRFLFFLNCFILSFGYP